MLNLLYADEPCPNEMCDRLAAKLMLCGHGVELKVDGEV